MVWYYDRVDKIALKMRIISNLIQKSYFDGKNNIISMSLN